MKTAMSVEADVIMTERGMSPCTPHRTRPRTAPATHVWGPHGASVPWLVCLCATNDI